MDLEGIMLSGISQRKDKHHVISLICVIKKTRQMNKQNINKPIDIENNLMAAKKKKGVKEIYK